MRRTHLLLSWTLGAGTVGAAPAIELRSTAFSAGKEIPQKYTCEGQDVSPPLSWSGVPAKAVSLALVVDDPDAPDPKAPKTTWVHWVVYDLPSSVTSLSEGERSPPQGASVGTNDFKKKAYGGPCPPKGRHRYFFKIYALDAKLPALEHGTKAELEKAMQGHVLATGELMGTYEKHGKKK